MGKRETFSWPQNFGVKKGSLIKEEKNDKINLKKREEKKKIGVWGNIKD